MWCQNPWPTGKGQECPLPLRLNQLFSPLTHGTNTVGQGSSPQSLSTLPVLEERRGQEKSSLLLWPVTVATALLVRGGDGGSEPGLS